MFELLQELSLELNQVRIDGYASGRFLNGPSRQKAEADLHLVDIGAGSEEYK